MISCASVCPSNHVQSGDGRVHHLAGDAGCVRRCEAGGRRNGAVHHRALPEPQKPHRLSRAHIPGHSP